jgi:hypothetical protein
MHPIYVTLFNRKPLMNTTFRLSTFVAILAGCWLLVAGAVAQEQVAEQQADAPADINFKVADDSLQMTATGTWKKVTPRSSVVEVEFAISKLGDDVNDGRLTIMASGGGVEANIARWKGQFVATPDNDPEETAKVEKLEVNGLTIHLVDISGIYSDSMGGPAGPKTEREGYRMLGAIIETEESGLYFVKFYGPQHTVGENEAHFRKLLASVKETGRS